MKPIRILTLGALTAMLALAACSNDEPERPPTNTVEEVDALPATPTPVPTPEASPALPPPDASIQSNAIDELAEEPVAPDAQMMDDAAATGMTARAKRDDPDGEAPADVVEEK